MNAEIFQINLLDWFAIWGAILVVLLVLMWFSREPAEDPGENAYEPSFDMDRDEEPSGIHQTRRCPPRAF